MKTRLVIMLALVTLLFAAACAPGPNPSEDTAADNGRVAGFWKGLWHGIIAPITFIISIFTKNVRFYEVHNSGLWYNFGFVLGAGLLFNGGFFGCRRKSKKRG